MYLNARNVCYLLSNDSILASIHLLLLPNIIGKEAPSQQAVERGMIQMQNDGYLECGPNGESIISIELAFLLTGIFTSPKALEWRKKDDSLDWAACCFENVYILLSSTRTGKWRLSPYPQKKQMLAALNECKLSKAGTRLVDRGTGKAFPPDQVKNYFEEDN